MKLQELLNKYIESTEAVLAEIEIIQSMQIDNRKVNSVIETVPIVIWKMQSTIGTEKDLKQD